jgi:hypothetical protein
VDIINIVAVILISCIASDNDQIHPSKQPPTFALVLDNLFISSGVIGPAGTLFGMWYMLLFTNCADGCTDETSTTSLTSTILHLLFITGNLIFLSFLVAIREGIAPVHGNVYKVYSTTLCIGYVLGGLVVGWWGTVGEFIGEMTLALAALVAWIGVVHTVETVLGHFSRSEQSTAGEKDCFRDNQESKLSDSEGV